MTLLACFCLVLLRLARELAEKEEAHITLEEHYSSLQEEVEVKTKKLKKLWNKWQAANREVQDLQASLDPRMWPRAMCRTSRDWRGGGRVSADQLP